MMKNPLVFSAFFSPFSLNVFLRELYKYFIKFYFIFQARDSGGFSLIGTSILCRFEILFAWTLPI